MKLLFTTLTLLIANFAAQAQQAKAYEMIKYTARQNVLIFKLNYADGYLGASTIRVLQAKKIALYQPQKGTTEENGDLRFCLISKAENFIVLHHINEMTLAPPTINGTQYINNQKLELHFKQVKP